MSTAPAPVPGIDSDDPRDEVEDLAREIRSIDGYLHALTADARSEAITRRAACIERLAWRLLQGHPLP